MTYLVTIEHGILLPANYQAIAIQKKTRIVLELGYFQIQLGKVEKIRLCIIYK